MSPGPPDPDPWRALLPICSCLGHLPGPPPRGLAAAAPRELFRPSPARAGKRATSEHLSSVLGKALGPALLGKEGLRGRLSVSAREPGILELALRREKSTLRFGTSEGWRGDGARPRLTPNRRPRAGARPPGEPSSGSEPAEWGRVLPPPRAGAGAGPGARPAQPMGAALEPPPPPREESARGLRRGDRERRAAPGPWVPGPHRAAWTARRPRKPDAQCGRQLRTRRPCARHIPSPSAPAPPAAAERGAPGRRRREAQRGAAPAPGAQRGGAAGEARAGGGSEGSAPLFRAGRAGRRAAHLAAGLHGRAAPEALAAPGARAVTGGRAALSGSGSCSGSGTPTATLLSVVRPPAAWRARSQDPRPTTSALARATSSFSP